MFFIHIIWEVLHRYNSEVFLQKIVLYHDAIEDCAAEEIFMRHDILKDMNISYYAYMDSNLAMILDAPR